MTSVRHKLIGESVSLAACSVCSLVAVGGVTEGDGVLAVHRVWDASSVRAHCPTSTLKMGHSAPRCSRAPKHSQKNNLKL